MSWFELLILHRENLCLAPESECHGVIFVQHWPGKHRRCSCQPPTPPQLRAPVRPAHTTPPRLGLCQCHCRVRLHRLCCCCRSARPELSASPRFLLTDTRKYTKHFNVTVLFILKQVQQLWPRTIEQFIFFIFSFSSNVLLKQHKVIKRLQMWMTNLALEIVQKMQVITFYAVFQI